MDFDDGINAQAGFSRDAAVAVWILNTLTVVSKLQRVIRANDAIVDQFALIKVRSGEGKCCPSRAQGFLNRGKTR